LYIRLKCPQTPTIMFRFLYYLIALAIVLFVFDLLFYIFINTFLIPNYQSLTDAEPWLLIIIFMAIIAFLGYAGKRVLRRFSYFVVATVGFFFPKYGVSQQIMARRCGRILFFLNSGLLMFFLWKSPAKFTFWVVMLLIIVSIIVLNINGALTTSPIDLKNRRRIR
jgi:hypothetical protein